jgi:hypothetical protein
MHSSQYTIHYHNEVDSRTFDLPPVTKQSNKLASRPSLSATMDQAPPYRLHSAQLCIARLTPLPGIWKPATGAKTWPLGAYGSVR